MAEFVRVASANEIAPGQARLVNVRGKEIALFNIEGTFFALGNACTHEEGPLAEGEIEGHEVTCPWHGARFDVRTGEVLCAPAYEDVVRYNVRVTGSDIEVEVEVCQAKISLSRKAPAIAAEAALISCTRPESSFSAT